MTDLKKKLSASLQRMGVDAGIYTVPAAELNVYSPIDGSLIGELHAHDASEIDEMIAKSLEAFLAWREVPAPVRGELIRRFGELLRRHKEDLGTLVSIENGKILQEGLGEVQEMIDVCDFAVGLSRQLYGLTIASERPAHKMRETWHPLGPVAIISAFNFPVAVWSWNTAIAVVCGDSVLWKPSDKTPITALACEALFDRAAAEMDNVPDALLQIVVGGRAAAEGLADDRRIPLVSATGSCAMGRHVAPRIAARLGRAILELGGNNAIIVCPSADLEMALRATVFGAVGTAGQRCTTTRRLFVHDDIYDDLTARLKRAYENVTIGDPLAEGTLVGPLIDKSAHDDMQARLGELRKLGATIFGGERVEIGSADAWYVRPALAEMPETIDNVKEETFAPLLYVFRYRDLDDAIRRNNDVPQGLSSSIFTTDMKEAERFTSAVGSDCGIVNVNIGTSGAEIGGAFGGEKDTGGGRESGSDAWKAYMRRSTSTVNYGDEMPLAQGVRFDV